MRIGVLPGSFNPPTIAHTSLIAAASCQVHRVAAVLPRTFPHKDYGQVTLQHRIAMLKAAQKELAFDLRVTDGGLFVDIARELREVYGGRAEFWFICGRDAAQRIVEWDYGHPDAIHHMLNDFGLLVAARQGVYDPPQRLAGRVKPLAVAAEIGDISSTDVRARIRNGEPWQHLVPPGATDVISEVYAPLRAQSKSG